MSRVFWDTNLFIYLIEDSPRLSEATVQLSHRMTQRNDTLFTSVLTLGEVLVQPLLMRNEFLQQRYEQLLLLSAQLLPFDADAARVYALLRADRSLRAPDAIQLACAATAGVDLFITNDERLARKVVPGIQFITSLDKSPI